MQFCLFGVRINITNDKKKIVPYLMEQFSSYRLFGVRINITNDKKKIVPSDMEKRRLENDVY